MGCESRTYKWKNFAFSWQLSLAPLVTLLLMLPNVKLIKRTQVGFDVVEHKCEASTYESRSNKFAKMAEQKKKSFKNVKTIGTNEKKSTNLLNTVNFIHTAWQKVTRKRHANAFHYGGFVRKDDYKPDY